MTTMTATYPEFADQVRILVEQHRRTKNNRLRLVVYFAPPRRAKRDIFLFEVIDGFGENLVDPTGNFFEFGYGSTPALPLDPGVSLRIMLTNPIELEHAIKENWKGIQQLRAARQAGQTTLIYADAKGKKLWESME